MLTRLIRSHLVPYRRDVGFVVVLVMAVMLESELRLLGRERLGQLPISAWLSGRRDTDRSE